VYFTTAVNVQRTPYASGQRAETPGMRTTVATFPSVDQQRWTHGVSISPGGTVYATQGVYSGMQCPDTPRNGTVQQLDGMGGMQVVASGFRNPMYTRCHFADETCLVAELGDDGGGGFGAHEKLVRIRPSTNYGFPCCTTTGQSTHYNDGMFDCSMVTQEEATFPLNDTPFGFDWERGVWPLPFNGALIVAKHGSFYSDPQWQGAMVVFAPTDPTTHLPTGMFQPLVEGFGHNGTLHRPADVAFGPDGRLFMADDQGNAVYWIAPGTLRMR
jgi:glucose/arabinose dehydrogenase